MTPFVDALLNPDFPFLRHALIAGLLSSVAFGVCGSYVVSKRISYIAGAIAHCVLGGIGVALWLRGAHGVEAWWCAPMSGAILAALIAALLIGWVSLKAKQREDTVIGALWAIGMAVGLLFLARTPGYVDPMSYLFGNILMITRSDLWLILALDVVIAAGGLLFYHNLLAICFDEEYARLRGISVERHYLGLLCLTALTVVLLVSVVGIVLVVALLTLPAAVAGHYARKLWQMMLLAVVLCAIFISGGLWASYAADLQSGPLIIIIAGAVYLVSTGVQALRE
ncbi:metal ABC transporter permease [Candidatus Sumerlaeota bacterium]|nr:metal ABC transporter permease [Candidatus Sumerlaeota bacterium]